MATFSKRKRKKGIRWTARIRTGGKEVTRTFGTLGRAEGWAKANEVLIETGKLPEVLPHAGSLFCDLVDAFLEHRKATRRPPGKTFANALLRLKALHGLETLETVTSAAFWRRHALDRIAKGCASQTAASELAYAGSVLQHAKRQGLILDATGPAEARRLLKDEGLRVSSRERTRRLSDDELQRLIDACDAVTSTIPLGAIVRFALSTSMRRDEILRLLRADVDADKRIALVRGRKHPKDQARVDEVPLMPVRRGKSWPKWDALKIIEAQPKGERVFPYVADSVSERFEHACRTAGLVGLVFHLLRHEALSRYAERGLDVMRLQLVGGHRDLRALARYARLTAQGLVNEK